MLAGIETDRCEGDQAILVRRDMEKNMRKHLPRWEYGTLRCVGIWRWLSVAMVRGRSVVEV